MWFVNLQAALVIMCAIFARCHNVNTLGSGSQYGDLHSGKN